VAAGSGRVMQKARDVRNLIAVLLAGTLTASCASVIHNEPVNAPISGPISSAIPVGEEIPTTPDGVMVGLAFSGGGTRAAAFSFGVLKEMQQIPLRSGSASLLNRVDFVSGVSGGSVTAAYYGLHREAALDNFREKFLLRNAEEGLETSLTLATLSRAVAGGVNDSRGLPRWLDANLFHGATFGSLRVNRRPRIWINASDIYNRTPFVFGATSFTALCSNLADYPIADAVAASAAIPVAFAPVVIKAYPDNCTQPLPKWIVKARDNPNAPPMLSAFAKATSRYRDGKVPFVKLLDGGLVDNYGLAGFTIARQSAEHPYEPMTPRQAVALRRSLFLVVDAKKGVAGDWVRTLEGPTGTDLVQAVADTAIDAGVGASYTAFESTMQDWQNALVRWRCGLSAAERSRLGAGPNWNCRDVKLMIGRISFDQFDHARRARLDAVPTRFHLPQQQVDEVIAAGRDALRTNPTLQAFLKTM